MKTTAADNHSFIEVLEAELREQIRTELLSEFGSQATSSPPRPDLPSTETVAHEHLHLWLNTNQPGHSTSRRHQGGSAAYNAYKQAAHESEHLDSTKSQSPLGFETTRSRKDNGPKKSRTRRAHDLDAMDIAALEFFRRQGITLPEDFDEIELKSAYHKVAMRVHPDRHVGANHEEKTRWGEIFADLNACVQRLRRHCKTASCHEASPSRKAA